MENNIFENATRKKYRFEYKGLITVEDLWDLSLTELDKIYKSLKIKVKAAKEEESLLVSESKEDIEINEQIEIIRYIVNIKRSENEAARNAKENAQRKQKIMDIIAKKQNEALENLSVEELTKLLNE